MDMKYEISEVAKHAAKQTVDVLSIVTALGTLVQFLPAVAALFTIIWTAIRIWETDTVRKWWRSKKRRSQP